MVSFNLSMKVDQILQYAITLLLTPFPIQYSRLSYQGTVYNLWWW